jgi:hypothetical protein
MMPLAERVIPELEIYGATKPAAASSQQRKKPGEAGFSFTSEDPALKRSGIRHAGARSTAKSC